jgi:hypothetical protein
MRARIKPRLAFLLVLFLGRSMEAATIVGDWPFDRTIDGVAVTDRQAVLEGESEGRGLTFHGRGASFTRTGDGPFATGER